MAKHTTKYTIFFLAVAMLAAGHLATSLNNPQDSSIVIDTVPYVLAEQETSPLPSRTWLIQAIDISKIEKMSPPEAARLYAYVTSIYSDTLEITGSTDEASLATAGLISNLYPKFNNQALETLSKLSLNFRRMGQTTQDQLNKYLTRSKNDGFNLMWDEKIPADKAWYLRTGQKDPTAASGKWQTWNINIDDIPVPPPPDLGGFRNKIDLAQFDVIMRSKNVDEDEALFFWEGRDNFYNPQALTLPLPGIWQNILYVEGGKTQADHILAKNQKILSQAVADALMVSWEAKYSFFNPRPSMILTKLNPLVKDPPSPSYISEYAAVGSAAQGVLTRIFPEKELDFKKLAYSSAHSRILAGVEFPSSVRSGRVVGERIAQATNAIFFPDDNNSVNPSRPYPNELIGGLQNLFQTLAGMVILITKDISLGIEKYLHPPAFTDQAEKLGLAQKTEWGAAWGDFNRDGFLDLMTSHGLYRNTGQDKFVMLPAVENFRAPGVWGDYNNDGCADFYAVKTGHSRVSNGEPDRLFRSDCKGNFTDVTAEAGIYDVAHGNSAAWVDYNNDGFLDIYVTNLGAYPGLDFDLVNPIYGYEPNILYRNNGNGTFTDVANEAGVAGLLDCPLYRETPDGLALKIKVSFQPMWFDFNNDRFMDLLVISDTFMSPLYRNNGNGTFTQVTEKAGLCGPERDSNMGAAVGDYNNDGWLDVFVNDNGDDYLWQNNKDGTFSNITKQVGVNEQGYGWGTEALDFDNDGYLDLLVVNGNNRIPAKSYFIPNLKRNDQKELFKNNARGKFTPVGLKEGLSGNDVNFSAAVADYNNDGFPDIFIPNSGERHLAAGSSLYKNRGNSNNWLTIQLVGTISNRDAVGTRLILKNNGLQQIREIISGSSYISQSTPWPTFGLGKNQTIDSLEVLWPSGLSQTFKNIKTNRKIIIEEGSDKIYGNLKDTPSALIKR